MKLTALFIAVAMICMTLEGCDSQHGYDTREVLAQLEGGLMRANQAFIEGFADRPAQIVTLDYRPQAVAGADLDQTSQKSTADGAKPSEWN